MGIEGFGSPGAGTKRRNHSSKAGELSMAVRIVQSIHDVQVEGLTHDSNPRGTAEAPR